MAKLDEATEVLTLTGLRGYASLWVMAMHYTWNIHGNEFLLSVARAGGSGLTVFFVLSGFILAHVYAKRFEASLTRKDFWRFIAARFARVYPVHALTLLLYAGMVLAGIIVWQGDDRLETLILNVALLQAWGFTNDLSWNQPSWSISTEIFAYLLFPFLWTVIRGSLARNIAMLMVVGGIVYLVPTDWIGAQLAQHFGRDPATIRFAYGGSLIYWFFVFCLGALLQPIAAAWLRIGHFSWAWDTIFAAGVACFVVICLYPSQRALMVWAAALVTFGLYRDKGIGRLLVGNPIIVFLGEISYSLYLTHVLTFWSLSWCGINSLAVKSVLALAFATCVHYVFERPVRRWMRSVLAPRRSQKPTRQRAAAIVYVHQENPLG